MKKYILTDLLYISLLIPFGVVVVEDNLFKAFISSVIAVLVFRIIIIKFKL